MKKLFLSALFLMPVSFGFADLTPGDGVIRPTVSKPANYISEAVYQSSQTCSNSRLDDVVISTGLVSLYSVNITSPGTGGSFLEIFDGPNSSTAGPARKISAIQTTLSGNFRQHFYEVSFSSQFMMSIQGNGGNPPCVDIIFRNR